MTSPYRYIPISKSHTTRLIRYQPKARGGGAKWRLALVNLAKVPDVRVRIESVLGELAVFEDLELPPD